LKVALFGQKCYTDFKLVGISTIMGSRFCRKVFYIAMEKVLTIVVPVFKVEKYIKQCLDSFIVPEILESLEVLVINDGSPDCSAEIARLYEKRYPKTFRVINKENGGHGSTINAGIQAATGKYFKVVDGDDWVSGDALRNLVSFLMQKTCDLVYSNYCWVDDETGKSKLDQKEPFANVMYGEVYAFEDIAEKTFIKMHNMTIRTAILKEHCKPITENCFYVDNEYILYPIPYVKTVAFLADVLYMYRIGRAEQSINIKKMQERCTQHKHVLEQLLSFYKDVQCVALPKSKVYLAQGIARMLVSQIKIYLSYKPGTEHKIEIFELDEEIRQNYSHVYFAVKNKAVWLLRRSNYHLYYPASLLTKLIYRV